ncbi:LAMI_0A08658g1_1 [Lachancea mirantina]|uniref:LAMI_0A08658g1_1 n=1 Tax=Lachancea mirantina TaxID=1230905 RepID=A0A1G4IRK4_9SACH|nr:LAMI_0A08658g1_1 [Lachancea mirantina]
MSVEESLDSIINNEKPSQHHKVTKYRRRDLRNGLAARMDTRITPRRDYGPRIQRDAIRRQEEPPLVTKKRLRISKIPLQTSDYRIEDLVREISSPTLVNFYDKKEERVAVLEFENEAQLEKVHDAINGKVVDEAKVVTEIFESQKRQQRRNQGRGERGPRRSRNADKEEAPSQPTADQLDAELDAYMKD